MRSKNVLITGGSGYVGTKLTQEILKKDEINIFNYDISLYGDEHLPNNKRYKYLKKDLRNKKAFKEALVDNKIDTVLHLACISNDPTFELKSEISKIINFECFEDLVKISKENKVKKFIYASTCSVYGVSDSPNVTEEHKLVPMTDYNKYKAMCEPILQKYLDNSFHGLIIRPATVCGFSEKMRFDLTVNILTNYAYNKGFIKVYGGEQTRPNIHIDDMCRLYRLLLSINFKDINGEIFNAGTENLKVIDIAKKIQKIMKEDYNKTVELKVEHSDDKRSYQINSDKIQKILKFNFYKNVDDAIKDLLENFEKGTLKDTFNSKWQNIQVLKQNIDSLNYSK